MKTSELIGAQLDYWVALTNGWVWLGSDGDTRARWIGNAGKYKSYVDQYLPSTNWKQGGPIIEREQIALLGDSYGVHEKYWAATIEHCHETWEFWEESTGPTPLIAAMRCYVASKFGDEVPEENAQ